MIIHVYLTALQVLKRLSYISLTLQISYVEYIFQNHRSLTVFKYVNSVRRV